MFILNLRIFHLTLTPTLHLKSTSFGINIHDNLFLTSSNSGIKYENASDANSHWQLGEAFFREADVADGQWRPAGALQGFTGRVTGSHGFSHFIACYKITGGHTPRISHQTSRSHAISFKADQRCSQVSGIGAQVLCTPGEFSGKDCCTFCSQLLGRVLQLSSRSPASSS